MKYLIISCSLNQNSKSRVLAKELLDKCNELELDIDFMDLQDYKLPICDGSSCYSNPEVHKVFSKIQKAKGIILCTPVYNFYASSAAKNLIELTGKDAWNDKIVGFMCAAGGVSSYMSVMNLANSLMLDFRCVIIPKFVYADRSKFGNVLDEDIKTRIGELADSFKNFVESLSLKRLEKSLMN